MLKGFDSDLMTLSCAFYVFISLIDKSYAGFFCYGRCDEFSFLLCELIVPAELANFLFSRLLWALLAYLFQALSEDSFFDDGVSSFSIKRRYEDDESDAPAEIFLALGVKLLAPVRGLSSYPRYSILLFLFLAYPFSVSSYCCSLMTASYAAFCCLSYFCAFDILAGFLFSKCI